MVALELKKLDLDVVALSETRLLEEGQRREQDYTFFWKGYDAGRPHLHGVGFAIKNKLLPSLAELPVGINERLMTLRVPLDRNKHATIISAYAPTLDAEHEVKEAFYSRLDTTLSAIPREDKIILLGDFNARVGRDANIWNGTIGREGIGNVNTNGTMLLSKCAEHDLIITNTLFQQKDKLKVSWQHPRSKHWHLLDYIIIRTKDRKDAILTRARIGTEDCWTDHRLVCCTLKVKINRRRVVKNELRTRYNLAALKQDQGKLNFQRQLLQHLPAEHHMGINEDWTNLKRAIVQACDESLGNKKHQRSDWFDDNNIEVQELLTKTRRALLEYLNCKTLARKDKHRKLKAEVQQRTRELKNEWWIRKSNEMQVLHDRNDTMGFFSAIKAIYGPSTQGLVPLRSKDGQTLLKSSEDILNRRRREHFNDLLNRSPHIDEACLDEIPQQPIDLTLNRSPTLIEVRSAIHDMKSNKAAGADNIPAEIYKHGGPVLEQQLYLLINKMWTNEEIPDDLRDGLIVTIYKKKGDKADCGNYRGITLLSTAGKIIARILNKRLIPLAENILPESQSGFRPSRGTTDMIFAARQLQEKCREQNQPLYIAFIDLTKAFDSVSRVTLWKILEKAGCPHKYINILKLLHDDMQATVMENGLTSEPFKVKSGVKQGCVIAPTLFSIFIGAVLHLTKNYVPPGIELKYRMDGKLLNLQRLRARTKVSYCFITELQYADDNAICATSELALQQIMDAFARAYSRLGLDINTRKTKVLFQPAPGDLNPREPAVTLNGETLENVAHFPHLGSFLSAAPNIDYEIHHRISSASGAFGKLRNRVFDDRDLRLHTKIKVYKSVVIPTLLYGSETWALYSKNKKALEQFHLRCLRTILGINREDHRTNLSILEESDCLSIEAHLIRNQLRWAGHLVRMHDTRLPKRIFYSELSQGARKIGRPMRRFKDNLKENLKKCSMNVSNWEANSLERAQWRAELRSGVESFEEKRREHMQDLRIRRHARRNQPRMQLPADNICPQCQRRCASRIGLISHLRTH